MKYLKDFQPGRIYRFRSPPLSTEEIISFAREWHPQRLHTDEAYATGSHGGLIASSFQTMLQVFKPVMHEMMTGAANIDGLDLEELRWPRPTPPGEALDIALEVNSATPSRSKPDRGVLAYTLRARNPAGEVVFATKTPMMIQRRASRKR